MQTTMPHRLHEHLTKSKMEKLRNEGIKLMRVSEEEHKKLKSKTPVERSIWLKRGNTRNKPCPCGSNIKFKKCCWSKV